MAAAASLFLLFVAQASGWSLRNSLEAIYDDVLDVQKELDGLEGLDSEQEDRDKDSEVSGAGITSGDCNRGNGGMLPILGAGISLTRHLHPIKYMWMSGDSSMLMLEPHHTTQGILVINPATGAATELSQERKLATKGATAGATRTASSHPLRRHRQVRGRAKIGQTTRAVPQWKLIMVTPPGWTASNRWTLAKPRANRTAKVCASLISTSSLTKGYGCRHAASTKFKTAPGRECLRTDAHSNAAPSLLCTSHLCMLHLLPLLSGACVVWCRCVSVYSKDSDPSRGFATPSDPSVPTNGPNGEPWAQTTYCGEGCYKDDGTYCYFM